MIFSSLFFFLIVSLLSETGFISTENMAALSHHVNDVH